MTMEIRLKDTTNDFTKIERNDSYGNFLKTLCENYEFIKPKKQITNHVENDYGQRKYFKASAFYMKEFQRTNERKVHRVEQNNKIYDQENDGNPRENSRADAIYKKLDLRHCEENERKFIHGICEEFPNQFYLEGDILGSTSVIKHHIRLIPHAKPVNVRQYRIPETQRQILNEIVKDYERQGLIEKCESIYNSPAILVKKKDEHGGMSDYRFVVDFRKLNEITEIQQFPIPLIDDILSGLSGCEYFTTLDLKGAFHQISVEEKSRKYTAFTANNFKYHWVRMPMGLASAPLTWQRAVNSIFKDLIGKPNNGLYIYLDDLIIYAESMEEHDKLLCLILQLLRENNIQLKISKCVFYAREFEYLGHIISKNGTRANSKKVEVINNYPRPTTVKAIQSFLGMCSYFRRYVRNFSQ